MKYNIYAGLGGSFGGPEYKGTIDSDSSTAENYAFELACDEYEDYAGFKGIRTIDEIMEEDEVGEEDAYAIYNEEREEWINYYIVPTDEDDEKNIEMIM